MSTRGSTTRKQPGKRETVSPQRPQRQTGQRREQERKNRNKVILWTSLIVVGIAVLGVLIHFIQSASPTSTTGPRVIDGISCQSGEGAVTHIHSALKLYVNGQPSTIPAQIGIDNADSCLYALHTHSTNDIIHEEAPDQKTYTLGEFFDIWGQPLSRTQVAGNTIGALDTLKIEVFDASGKLTPYTGDPRTLALADHETIVILDNSSNVQPTPFTNWQNV